MPIKLISKLLFRSKRKAKSEERNKKRKIEISYLDESGKEESSKKSKRNSDRPQKRGQKKRESNRNSDRNNQKKQNRKDNKPEKSSPKWSIDQFKVEPKEGKVRFHDIGLDDRIMHAIHDLGFEYCTPIQAKTLTHASQGQNIAGRAQTGTGKTAAFLIMLLQRYFANPIKEKWKKGTPCALVLAPTRELVMQIEKDARALSKHCRFRSLAVYGGMDLEKQRKMLEENRPIDLIAATPGRLIDFKNRGVIDLSRVQTLIIDEADRMLDMGFIPDVRKIISATPAKNKRRTMLFSATLTDEVMRLASQWMPDPAIVEIDPEQVTVDTIDQKVYAIATSEKFALLMNLLKRENPQKVLIFRNRRNTTEKLHNELNRYGIKCEMLSGAVSQKQRFRVLENFHSGKTNIIVATDVAGRGIHVDDISHVFNYDFPYEPEDYVHRIGRTGRAGIKGTAISFACEDESFIIPDIEEYIGRSLSCTVPEEELVILTDEPDKNYKPKKSSRAPDRQNRGSGQRRQGGNRSRGPRRQNEKRS